MLMLLMEWNNANENNKISARLIQHYLALTLVAPFVCLKHFMHYTVHRMPCAYETKTIFFGFVVNTNTLSRHVSTSMVITVFQISWFRSDQNM